MPTANPRILEIIKPLVGSIAALLLSSHAQAQANGSATWIANPVDNTWFNSNNWTPATPPNSTTDVATFNTSAIVSIDYNNFSGQLGGIVFNPGASAFAINVGGNNLSIYGAGIANGSGKVQNIVIGDNEGTTGTLNFFNNSTAGARTAFTVNGSLSGGEGSALRFFSTSSAGGATLVANGGTGTDLRNGANIVGGGIYFLNDSTGGTSTVKVFGNGFLDISSHNHGNVTIGSLEGSGNVFLGSNNLTVGSNNLSTVFSGVIQDGGEGAFFKAPTQGRGVEAIPTGVGGTLTKIGTGTLNLTGNNTYTGNTFVNGGTLLVNGSIVSPETFVNSGGTLGGSGHIGGAVINNGGTVSPGNSPGTLTIQGNYSQGPGGTLFIQLGSSSVYDRLVIGGAAALGGTLDVDLLDGFKPKRNETFQFLTAGGGVSGTFSNFIQSDTGTILKFKIVYQNGYAVLESVVSPFTALTGLTPNQTSVANELDRVVNDRRSGKLLDFLAAEPLGALPNDFDKIAAEEYTSIFTLGTSYDNVQSLNVQRRTDAIRSGASGFSAAGLAINGINPSFNGPIAFRTGVAGPSGDDGKESKEVKQVVAPDSRWGAFLTGTGEWVGVGDDFNARGYDIATGGFTLGVDYKVSSQFAVGLMAGYVGSGVDLNDGGRVYVNGGKLGLYATFFQNQPPAAAPTMSKDSSKDSSKELPAAPVAGGGFYADVAVTGGYSSYDLHRSALQGTARGDTDGGDLNVLFGAGYDIKKGGFTFGPTASFNYTYVGVGSFTETGSLAPLHFQSQGQESIRTAFGVKASYDWKVGGVVIQPELRAAWQHEYGDASYEIDSSFANGAGNTFTVNGPRIGRDSLLVGAGFSVQLSDRCATYFYYDGELARTRYDSHNVSGGVRISF